MAPASHLPIRDFAQDAWGQGGVYTQSNGVPLAGHPYSSQRVGEDGPLLLQDFHLIDLLSHFDRERIPERVVHAKGGGAHGVFRLTKPIPEHTVAQIFSKPGAECPVTVRFSTVGGESGSPDAARDPRGFSVKFRTEEGNMDWVYNNTPIFFLRDPAKFPNFIHTQKRDPRTHATHADDSTHFWNYVANNPESIHQMLYLWGPRGIPATWRHMQGYSGHTFKFVNDKGEWKFIQIHILSNQGTKNLHPDEAAQASPDVHQLDLFDAIERGEYPSWTVKYQIATAEEAEAGGLNVFDLTRTWDRKKFPLHELGVIELNQNVANYFAEMEQVAFNPAHLVPGIEPSADPVLQSRLFSYPDAHRHRVGTNYQQLPVNQHRSKYPDYNFQRDGPATFYNQGGRPLHLSSLAPPTIVNEQYDIGKTAGYKDGHAVRFLSGVTAEDFVQPRELWTRVFSEEDRKLTTEQIAGHMQSSRDKVGLAQAINIFWLVDKKLGDDLGSKVGLAKGSWQKPLEVLEFLGSHNFAAKKDALKLLQQAQGAKGAGINGAAHANGNGVAAH